MMPNLTLIGCRVLSLPPVGSCVVVVGCEASCGYCREVVYPQLAVLRDHDFAWDGYRMTWYSRSFGTRVHACAADTERIETAVHDLVNI